MQPQTYLLPQDLYDCMDAFVYVQQDPEWDGSLGWFEDPAQVGEFTHVGDPEGTEIYPGVWWSGADLDPQADHESAAKFAHRVATGAYLPIKMVVEIRQGRNVLGTSPALVQGLSLDRLRDNVIWAIDGSGMVERLMEQVLDGLATPTTRDLTFGEALAALETGRYVSRPALLEENKALWLNEGEDLFTIDPSGYCESATLAGRDLLASDWAIVTRKGTNPDKSIWVAVNTDHHLYPKA